MKKQHLNWFETEAHYAFGVAADLQWADPELAQAWYCYALENQAIARQIAATPAREYVRLVIEAQQPQTQQLSLF